MATVINTTFKLKRGTAARWAEVNPILEEGEPGFSIDTNQLKVGNGVTPWNDLPYIEGKQEVENYNTVDDFPEIGDPRIIYKALEELSLYQFDPYTLSYLKINGGSELDDIQIINGGTA